jgi:hypothetical protein
MGGVFFQELLLIFRQLLGHKDRVRCASGDTCSAIDATFGIDVKLGGRLELGLILLGVDAVGGTDLDAKLVFDARIGDYIRHCSFS